MYANSTWKKKLTLLRDTEESFLKKIGISWVGRLNIIKMSFTSILICKLNTIPIEKYQQICGGGN